MDKSCKLRPPLSPPLSAPGDIIDHSRTPPTTARHYTSPSASLAKSRAYHGELKLLKLVVETAYYDKDKELILVGRQE